ncbi:MAG TPA: tripartite tricarboxylate transporter TctB family protein [Nitrospinota bacterium]|jgi:hypothetical protein|nr:tripartite tricarboxylate transporter TctB family protein [Nitrospinota bacterium]HJM41982.1 tripartite tricarboxylate transporter TctB family protein [Nitrospinota bacterium]
MRRIAPPAALFVFSLLMGWFAHGLGLGNLSRPAPGFFPFWISIGLAATSLHLMVQSIREGAVNELAASLETAFSLSGFRRVIAVMAGTALFGLLLEYLGFLLTTFIFMAFCWLAVDRQPLLRGLLISAAVSGASLLLFAKILNVHFPRGLLGF